MLSEFQGPSQRFPTESSSLAPRSHELPPQPTALIGRGRELSHLTDILTRPEVRLLTLTGVGGTGKTRLAIEVAAAQCESFEHGCVFVDLAVVSTPAVVPSALATAVGLRDIGSQPLLDTLKLYLRERHLLAVLDNFEHLLDAAPLLPDLLSAAPRLKVIVTSRAALRLWRWEHEFAVPPLALPDRAPPVSPDALASVPSVSLFVERARARRADFSLGRHNASAVADICVRLDGLPLALELAAAAIKVLSPQSILDRLQKRLDLPGKPGGDFPSRHQTLRAAVAWSYDLLAPTEQALLRRLAVFAGGFSAEAAEAICADDTLPSAEILPLLGRLVDQSLVVPGERDDEVRYRLLELIREFARQQLEESGEAEHFRRQHAEWCVALGLEAEAGLRGVMQSVWLDRLETEHDNLRQALDWLAEGRADDTAPGVRPTATMAQAGLSAALVPADWRQEGGTEDSGSLNGSSAAILAPRLAAALWQFWWLRGYLSEGRQQLERVLSLTVGVEAAPHAVRALLAAGTLAFRQGDYEAARQHLGSSLERARTLGNASAAAAALRNLGRMAIDRGDFAVARERLQQSLAIERALDSPFGTAWSLNYLGLLEHFAGDNAAARAFIEQSLPMLRALQDQWGTAVALAYLGRVASDEGDRSAAAAMWQESLATCRKQGYLWCIPYLLEFLAGVAIAGGDGARGMRLAGAAEALHATIGAPLPPVWHADRERDLEPARRALSPSAYATALEEGRALSLDNAIAEASLGAQLTRVAVGQASSSPPPNPLKTRYARSGDVSIAYQIVGAGSLDLVFVMGWVSHLDSYWQEPGFARFLRRLASFARVILFDKRGTGLSDRSVGLPTLEQRMDDVRAVMDAVDSKRTALVGISEGGTLCTLFAATYPERTAALVLVGCVPRLMWAPDYPWGANPDERAARVAGMGANWASPAWVVADLERRAPTVAHDEQFGRWWSSYLRQSASPGAAQAVSQMNSQIDIRPVLPSVRVPTLVIHRIADRAIPVEASRYLAGHIPNAQLVELLGEDHLPFVGDQDAVLDPIEEFLTGVRPTAPPDRVLATVLAVETVHTAATIADVGAARWRTIETTYAALARDQVHRFRGRQAGAGGSGLLVTFDGPARGIRCAQAIIEASRRLGLGVRAALHTGECDLIDGQLRGRRISHRRMGDESGRRE
jgi:predicted ATPase/pimeloyl-ACP methyl ester carboxylesterase